MFVATTSGTSSGPEGGAARSTSSIAGARPAIVLSGPISTAISGSALGACAPVSECEPSAPRRLPEVRWPTTGPDSSSASCTCGGFSPTFQPIRCAPLSSAARQWASWRW